MKKIPEANYFRTYSIANFDGVEAAGMYLTSGGKSPRHIHREYVFSLTLEGVSQFYCGHCRTTHIVKPGDILLTEAHEVYAAQWSERSAWRSISLSVSKEKLLAILTAETDGRAAKIPHFASGAVRHDELQKSFAELHQSLTRDGFSALEREARLYEWLIEISRSYSESPNLLPHRRAYNETAAVRAAREFIHENLSENFDLQTLAQIAELSPFYLNRTFSAQIGLPPHEYQNQLRIKKSLELLRRKTSFAEIALELGFSDQSHFNRFFKRYLRVTPQKFSRDRKIVL